LSEDLEKMSTEALNSVQFRVMQENVFLHGYASHLLAEQIITEGETAVTRFRSKQGDALARYDMGDKLLSEAVEAEKTKVIFAIGQETIDSVISDARKRIAALKK